MELSENQFLKVKKGIQSYFLKNGAKILKNKFTNLAPLQFLQLIS